MLMLTVYQPPASFGPAEDLLIYFAESERGKLWAFSPREFTGRFGRAYSPGEGRIELKVPD